MRRLIRTQNPKLKTPTRSAPVPPNEAEVVLWDSPGELVRNAFALRHEVHLNRRLTGMNWFALLITPLLAQAAEATPTPASTEATLLQLLKAGGWVMIPLVLTSVVTLALVFACLFSLRRGTVVTRRFMETAEALLRKRDYLGLIAVSNRHSEAVARITSRTLDFATKNPAAPAEAVREVAETEGSRVVSSLNSRIVYLADIATLSQFSLVTPLNRARCFSHTEYLKLW